MTFNKNKRENTLKYISYCLLLICLQPGSIHGRGLDPKYGKAVLDALGMKRIPENADR